MSDRELSAQLNVAIAAAVAARKAWQEAQDAAAAAMQEYHRTALAVEILRQRIKMTKEGN